MCLGVAVRSATHVELNGSLEVALIVVKWKRI